MQSFVREREAAIASPVYGLWDVESHVIAGRELADTADPARWRRLAVGSRSAAVRLATDEVLHCQPERDDVVGTLVLTCRGDRKASCAGRATATGCDWRGPFMVRRSRSC